MVGGWPKPSWPCRCSHWYNLARDASASRPVAPAHRCLPGARAARLLWLALTLLMHRIRIPNLCLPAECLFADPLSRPRNPS